MTDYWKSNDRKFCNLCKCWFGDNKVSNQIHEQGKGHKDAVKAKLSELAKKGSERAREEAFNKKALAYMEKAALRAAQKDMLANPDLADQYGAASGVQAPVYDVPNRPASTSRDDDQSAADAAGAATLPEWAEAKTDEGVTYFWHMFTGDTRWTPPEDGVFLSLEQQRETIPTTSKDESSSATAEAGEQKHSPKQEQPTSEQKTTPNELARASIGRKRPPGPLGQWTPVDTPTITAPPAAVPEVKQEDGAATNGDTKTDKPKSSLFKERSVDSINAPRSAGSTFKKRKIAGGARNLKARTDDD